MQDQSAPLRKLEVLVVEPNDEEAQNLVSGLSARMPEIELNFLLSHSYAETSRALAEYSPDVVLVNVETDVDHGRRLIDEIFCRAPHAAIIGISSDGDLETGLDVVRAGVQDYLVRGSDYLDTLSRSILFSFERKSNLNYSEAVVFRDPVTGALNRLAFMERLRYAIASARRRRERFCLASFMFHGFDAVRESFGNSACEILLREIGERFLDKARETDVLARFGENHFVGIFENITETSRPLIVERMQEYLSQPFILHDAQDRGPVQLKIAVTMGLSLYPDHAENINVEEDAHRLMFAADVALKSTVPGAVDNCIMFDSVLFEQPIIGKSMH